MARPTPGTRAMSSLSSRSDMLRRESALRNAEIPKGHRVQFAIANCQWSLVNLHIAVEAHRRFQLLVDVGDGAALGVVAEDLDALLGELAVRRFRVRLGQLLEQAEGPIEVD